MKKLAALVLVWMMLCASALAEFTVEVDWFGGKEVYSALHVTGMSLQLNEETGYYETKSGLVWQAEVIPFGTLSDNHLPYSERQVRNMNQLYAALEDASGFWDTPVTDKGRLAVYSAPDETSFRGADGKAAVELSGGVRLMMTLGDWAMVEYDVDRHTKRTGWVQKTTLGSAPVMFTDIPVTLYEGAVLTDDPHGFGRDVMRGKLLSDVHLLARLDSLWGYVRAELADGQAIWGFVPLCDIRLTNTVDTDCMAKVAGKWQFASGGNLLPDDFTLLADGTAAVAGSPAEWMVVNGTAGYEHDLLLIYADGRVKRLHLYGREDDRLTLTQGEAGGTWQRVTE